MKKTQNIILLIICLILIFLAYVFFKGGRVYLANFLSNISDQETKIVSDIVENINNQPVKKIWNLEESWIENKDTECSADGIIGNYCIEIKKCNEVNIGCFENKRKEFNLIDKSMVFGIINTIGENKTNQKESRRIFFEKSELKWNDWDDDFKIKFIYSLFESNVSFDELPQWLKDYEIVIQANKDWGN